MRRLRGQASGNDPDRHERAIARPRLAKGKDDEDDAPTYVDESNHNLLKDEYEALIASDKNGENRVVESAPEKGPHLEDTDERRAKQDITEAGDRQKKRKAVKQIAVDEEDDLLEKKTLQPIPKKKAKKRAQASTLSFVD